MKYCLSATIFMTTNRVRSIIYLTAIINIATIRNFDVVCCKVNVAL